MKFFKKVYIIQIILIFSLPLFFSGCQKFIAEIFINKGLENFNKIYSFEGIIHEKGVLSNNKIIKSAVKYKRPDMFKAIVIEPEPYKGDYFGFDGTNMYVYYKMYNFGILISGINNIIPNTYKKTQQRLKKNALNIINNYKIRYLGRDQIAGRKTYSYRLNSKIKNRYCVKEIISNDIEYTIPLKLVMHGVDDKLFYGVSYEKISFNNFYDINEFRFSFPKNAIVGFWDLNAYGYNISEIKQLINFKLHNLNYMPPTMKLIKIVKADGPVPSVCMIYYDGTYHIILTQIRDYGLITSEPRGINIDSIAKNAKLNLLGEECMLFWKKNNVLLTLASNLPYYQVIKIAKNIN